MWTEPSSSESTWQSPDTSAWRLGWSPFPSHHVCILHFHACVHVCARSSIFLHTQRSPEAAIYPCLSLFIFLLPPSPLPPPCCSPVWPQINRVHSVQTHSVTIFNHWPQKGPLESPAYCSYRRGHAKSPHAHTPMYTSKDTHTHTRR